MYEQSIYISVTIKILFIPKAFFSVFNLLRFFLSLSSPITLRLISRYLHILQECYINFYRKVILVVLALSIFVLMSLSMTSLHPDSKINRYQFVFSDVLTVFSAVLTVFSAVSRVFSISFWPISRHFSASFEFYPHSQS